MKNLIIPLFLSLLAVSSLSLGMEPEVPQITRDPLLDDESSYVSMLPKDVYLLLQNYRMNGNSHPASDLWLFKAQEEKEFACPDNPIKDAKIMSYDPKSNHLLLNKDNTYTIWNANKNCIEKEFPQMPGANFFVDVMKFPLANFDSENKLVFMQDYAAQRNLIVRDLTNNKEKVFPTQGAMGLKQVIHDVRNGTIILCNFGTRHGVKIIDFERGNDIQTLNADKMIVSLAFDDASQSLFVAGTTDAIENTIGVWDLSNMTCLQEWNAHKDIITSIILDPVRKNFLSVDKGGIIKIWDLKNYTLKKIIPTNTKIYDARFDNTCNWLISVPTSNSNKKAEIRIWDLAKEICIGKITYNQHQLLLKVFYDTFHKRIFSRTVEDKAQIRNLHDPQIKKELWDRMTIYKQLVIERAYEVWLHNQKTFFWNSQSLDLATAPLLFQAWKYLPKTLKKVISGNIKVIKPAKSIRSTWIRRV